MSISNFDFDSATILEQNWKKSQTKFFCPKKEDLSGISEKFWVQFWIINF